MIAVVPSATLLGAIGHPVAVEVHVSRGIPGFTVVGLPDAAVRESRDRVRAALLSSGHEWPVKRITVNLAPSSVRKSGAGLDLPIALGVLVASGDLPAPAVKDAAFIGELGLDGSLRHVPGILALADAVSSRSLVVPECDRDEARVARPVRIAANLRQLTEVLVGGRPWPTDRERPVRAPGPSCVSAELDLADVRGQRLGRRAVEVAAAGGHHLLMIGPPGSGKTMLAERVTGLLPRLTRAEAVEVSRIHSSAGVTLPPGALMRRPPFRAPHHGASGVSLIGGGTSSMRPGEISLATHGVLFLDELGEFPAAVLDTLRQPLEEGLIRVCRARAAVEFPARFLLVAAMNPCPCGEAAEAGRCRCTPTVRARYLRRLSGPLLDRFDVVVALHRPDPDELLGSVAGEPSQIVRKRVASARLLARERGVRCNAELSGHGLDEIGPLTPSASALLERRVRQGTLSGRGLHRVRRVARTIADLDGGAPAVDEAQVAEALALRGGRELLNGEAR